MHGGGNALIKGSAILLLDDDPTLRAMAGSALRQAGCKEFTHSVNSQRALDSIASRATDVLIMDCRCRAFDGIGVLNQIRSLEAGRKLPVIIVTASSDGAQAYSARKLLVTSWLTKPVPQDVLLAHIAAALARAPAPSESCSLAKLSTGFEDRLAVGLQDLTQVATRVQTGHRSFASCADDMLRQLQDLAGHADLVGYTRIAETCSALHALQRLAVAHAARIESLHVDLALLIRIGAASMHMLAQRQLRGDAGEAGQLIADQVLAKAAEIRGRIDAVIGSVEKERRTTMDAMAVRRLEVDTDIWHRRKVERTD